MADCEVSIVLGSLNRRRLLQETLRSIRVNGFKSILEIIVVDGGSTDGTCEWLARQRDVLTLVQPNYRTFRPDGFTCRKQTWKEFVKSGSARRAHQGFWSTFSGLRHTLYLKAICGGS